MARKYRTPESYRDEVYALTDGEYTVIGEFTGALIPILHRHTACGNEYRVRPNNFIDKGSRCPKCFGTPKRTHSDYVAEITALVGDEYTVLDEYINARSSLLHRHNTCGHLWRVRPACFVNGGSRCPKCFGTPKRTHSDYLAEVKALIGEEYTVLGEYKNANAPILHRHNKCNHEYSASPHNFINKGTRCPKCASALKADKNRKTHSNYVAESLAQAGEEYTVLGQYANNDTPILHRHNVCGHEWKVRPNSFISGGSRCPRCAESKGERRIAKLLDFLNVSYTRQFRHDDCRAKKPLPFDFAVHYEDGTVLIEYDGRQHRESVEAFGGDTEFRRRTRHDRIKTEYCRANGIPLIRIDYTEFDDIEPILIARLTELNVIGNRSTTELDAREAIS